MAFLPNGPVPSSVYPEETTRGEIRSSKTLQTPWELVGDDMWRTAAIVPSELLELAFSKDGDDVAVHVVENRGDEHN